MIHFGFHLIRMRAAFLRQKPKASGDARRTEGSEAACCRREPAWGWLRFLTKAPG